MLGMLAELGGDMDQYADMGEEELLMRLNIMPHGCSEASDYIVCYVQPVMVQDGKFAVWGQKILDVSCLDDGAVLKKEVWID